MLGTLFKTALTVAVGAGIGAVVIRLAEENMDLPLQRERHPVRDASITTAEIVAIAAIGAGVMFMFDPAKGRSRRAWLMAKATSRVHRAGKVANRMGRHFRNKMRGQVHHVSEAAHHWLTGNGHHAHAASM